MNKRNSKKIIVSLFTALLLTLALLVPSVAKTDAERELEAANAEVIALEQQLADAKTALSEAQTQSRKGMYGFFEANGSTGALKALDNAKYKNLIAYGTAGDATSLDNLDAALDLLDAVNDKRAEQGLSPLMVTDTMMAMAEADADAYYDLRTTPKQFTIDGNKIAENLGTFADAKTAADSWYAEKAVADEHPEYMEYSNANWSRVGHYFNMTREKYTVTGAAVNTRLGNKFCQVYYSTAGSEKTYTVAQYRQRVADYKASLTQKQQDITALEAALQTAKTRQATAQRIVEAEQSAAETTAPTA